MITRNLKKCNLATIPSPMKILLSLLAMDQGSLPPLDIPLSRAFKILSSKRILKPLDRSMYTTKTSEAIGSKHVYYKNIIYVTYNAKDYYRVPPNV